MSSGEENFSSESPTMEFIEEPKPNIQLPLPTPLPSTISSNPLASPPQNLFTSNSPPPPPPAPQPPSAITSPPLPPSTFTSVLPPPRFSTNSPPPQLPAPPHPPSSITSPSLPPSTFSTSPPPVPRPPRFSDNLDDDQYFNSFPPGYRFCPHDHELVMHYLTRKVRGLPLPRSRIVDVTLYQHDPEFLADKYKQYGEKEWYFFTPRERKYKNGTRPNRAAGDGYWKATGADKQVIYDKAVVGADGRVTVEKVLVGYRKALVYYHGKAPKGYKTNWIMHEYRVDGPPQVRNHNDEMRLDDWVLCRIYKKQEKRNPNVRNRQRNEENSPASMDEDQNYVNDHDRDSNDLADYGEEIGSLENAFPTHDDDDDQLSQQHPAMSGLSDCVNYYHSSRMMFQDTQVPSLDDIYAGPAVPTFSANPYINWISSQRGCQDEYLINPTYMPQYCSIADPYLDRHSGKPINLPRNPSPLVNFRPTNTAPPAHGLSYMNTTAPPIGTVPPTNTASLTCSFPPTNTTGSCLPPTNPALVAGLLAPANPAINQPISAMNVVAKLPRQPPRAQQQ